MKRHPVANTYARALLEVGQERGQAEDYAEELRAIEEQVLATGDARVFLESPKIPRREKKEVLERVFQGKVSDAVLNLLHILIDRGRQMLFGQIAEAYQDFCDEAAGRQHVRITSAVALDTGSRDSLTRLLSAKLSKQIVAEERVDEGLLGGMTIRIGDTVIDGSVRSRLNEIREQVASRRLGSDLIA